MNRSRRNEARYFNENSPRPPVPGEETESYVGRYYSQSPALTPRRSALGSHLATSSCDASAPLGFEPEGSCGIMETNSPPACLRWARSIQSLLLDREGLHLFRSYVTEEGNQNDIYALEFWLACVGLKEPQNADKTSQLVKAIYRKYIVKAQLEIPEDVKKETKRRLKETWPEENIFDNAQLEAEHLMARTSYPNFLQSDMYLQYVQACQNPEQAGGCPSSSSSRDISLSCGPSLLPTLHEDTEYHSIQQHISRSACDTPSELRLTKDVLMATQKTRALDVRPKPEAYAGLFGIYVWHLNRTYLQPGTSPYHMSTKGRVQYSSYNPVSRQDSELQSLSSDARTESDNLSITDSMVDGMSTGRPKSSKKQFLRHSRAIKESASLNRDPLLHTMIPRTDRASKELTKPPDPERFAQELFTRLELLKRQIDNEEKLKNLSKDSSVEETDPSMHTDTRKLADALCQKLSIDDDNDQDILDQHVSRVWSDPTPSRSPGIASPKSAGHNYSRSHKQRKDKDGYSTFSIDSGNIHDFAEGDFAGASSLSSSTTHLPKSKSVPSEFADCLHKPDLYLQGQDQRFRRSDMSRRSATKKSLTELTDSGVSVVSASIDVPAASKDCRTQWRNQLEKKNELKHMRHGKKYGSRSGSLERANREEWGGRAQPFLGDPGMPLLPQPHIPTQLEEAKRRLLEEDRARGGSSMYSPPSSSVGFNRRMAPAYRQSHDSSCSLQHQPPQPPQGPNPSNQSTLRKSRQDVGDFTIVVFNFCDESVPYRTKIPGHNVTLKRFKEFLPKKGSYRYFFKTECEDLDTKVIQEEITDDSEVLPLWEGKVMAQVKALE
ncbi:axin isoform X1 [Cotesia glomerata]|uniref:Similar to AXIN1: Axin-1 (Homo sapiens) n=2 Tax=Cotesia TaxID=32390 RepID=A0A8J2MLB6_COTCN|nr:axin isoform X1 [Cotesia glomerata]XP_044591323.1 axin isoform X1 [Cotesia glomerata]XP_044591324.1 axin isoform X1 [Cotesia glomerata]XP_044591325.1 axin isoform X1 [Cotesia glomerata]XP_044591326.1 axin isoform X1 [Cotesia glomerata]XP_044591327.1 axin isoform X1 [Cotesia glomerata]CAG5093620.1 Similar to AXIN1: Axin-1 (Homo sapiens) [Cotesia congregata]